MQTFGLGWGRRLHVEDRRRSRCLRDGLQYRHVVIGVVAATGRFANGRRQLGLLDMVHNRLRVDHGRRVLVLLRDAGDGVGLLHDTWQAGDQTALLLAQSRLDLHFGHRACRAATSLKAVPTAVAANVVRAAKVLLQLPEQAAVEGQAREEHEALLGKEAILMVDRDGRLLDD